MQKGFQEKKVAKEGGLVMTSRTDLDELERLLAAMTPEPWTCHDGAGYAHPYVSIRHSVSEAASPHVARMTEDGANLTCTIGKYEFEVRNAVGIVALRNAVPALIRELRALREVEKAAICIRHWHDREPDGMVVSAEHVRALWAALAKAQEARDANR
jgi:hypothetical protein